MSDEGEDFEMSAVSLRTWWLGARPRTLPAALAPVAVGAGVAVPTSPHDYRSIDLLIFVLCLVVAFALQIGVNYANDYSDGVRGTDTSRVGPVRLVGQGLAPPEEVRRAAFVMFAVAAVAGLVVVLISQQWWLLIAGALAIAAAWFYTGGTRPYGYAGLGEVMVFVFFGLMAVVGTAAALTGVVTLMAVVAAIPVGLLACALLLVNNLRDLRLDKAAGKLTLATRIGPHRTRTLYVWLVWLPFAVALVMGITGLLVTEWPSLAALPIVTIPMAAAPARAVRNGAEGAELIDVLGSTARLLLEFSLLLAVGLALPS